jgi:hypothetical protein
MSYYQYEPPVAMFSMAEVDKYNGYEGTGMALFARVEDRAARIAKANAKRAQQGKAGLGSPEYVMKRAGRNVARAGQSAGSAAGGFTDSVGRGAGKGFGSVGKGMQAAGDYAGRSTRQLGVVMRKNPRLAGAALLAGAVGAAGAGGTMFMRRRRSKTGKMIVEQVRR